MEPDPIISTDAILRWSYDVGIFGFMNSKWGWPTVESVHFIGLALLMGCVGAFDLRMIGVARGLSMQALHRLVPFGVLGFAMNAGSGFLFFTAAPAQYLYNPAFQLKALSILIAGINMMLFYATTARAVRALGPEDDAPLAAKIIAGVSLASWVGVITFGRLLTFFRPPYHWCFWC